MTIAETCQEVGTVKRLHALKRNDHKCDAVHVNVLLLYCMIRSRALLQLLARIHT